MVSWRRVCLGGGGEAFGDAGPTWLATREGIHAEGSSDLFCPKLPEWMTMHSGHFWQAYPPDNKPLGRDSCSCVLLLAFINLHCHLPLLSPLTACPHLVFISLPWVFLPFSQLLMHVHQAMTSAMPLLH